MASFHQREYWDAIPGWKGGQALAQGAPEFLEVSKARLARDAELWMDKETMEAVRRTKQVLI